MAIHVENGLSLFHNARYFLVTDVHHSVVQYKVRYIWPAELGLHASITTRFAVLHLCFLSILESK